VGKAVWETPALRSSKGQDRILQIVYSPYASYTSDDRGTSDRGYPGNAQKSAQLFPCVSLAAAAADSET